MLHYEAGKEKNDESHTYIKKSVIFKHSLIQYNYSSFAPGRRSDNVSLAQCVQNRHFASAALN